MNVETREREERCVKVALEKFGARLRRRFLLAQQQRSQGALCQDAIS